MRLHFVGIGGAGMSSLARFAHEAGYVVTGSDRRAVDPLQIGEGVVIWRGHDPSNIVGADAVVLSSAVPEGNIERLGAARSGVPILKRGELLALFVAEHPHGVAVCGTHGKGTTSGALVTMLEAANLRVSYVLGAPMKGQGHAARCVSDADVLVAEVDESDRTHLAHRPRHLLINNLEVDHLHTYEDLGALVRDFVALLCEHFPDAPIDDQDLGSAVIGCYGEGIPPLLEAAGDADIPVLTCGVSPDVEHADALGRVSYRADGTLSVEVSGRLSGVIESPLKGALNARNLVTAAMMASTLGVSFEAIKAGAARYRGLVDRFDEFESAGRWVVTDYTSHPTSITGNLRALRTQHEGAIHAIFQPFRYSLLDHFWSEYIDALCLADRVHVLQMDGAGEDVIEGINCARLTEALITRGTAAVRYHDLPSLERGIADEAQSGEVVIVFGGGPLFGMARSLPKYWSVEH